MLRLSHITATGLLLLGLSANLSAEEINLPDMTVETTEIDTTEFDSAEIGATEVESTAVVAPTPAEATEYTVQLPGRGMSMEEVQKRFGEALEKYSAVGDPPISKWTYKNFTVYFESEFVIHAVVNN